MKNLPTWAKATIAVVISCLVILAVTLLVEPSEQSLLTRLMATPTPTVTATTPPTLTATVTPIPTATPSPTFTTTPIPPPVPTLPPTAVSNTSTPSQSAPSPPPTDIETSNIPTYTYKIINTYPHDPKAFSQGLIFADDIFYESTGLRGQSSLRKVDVESGQVLQYLQLPPELFGEGITIFGERLIQLTWQANVGLVFNKDSFELLQTFTYPTEGWGITHDGQQLIMSDGSATLYFWEPETLAEIGRLR